MGVSLSGRNGLYYGLCTSLYISLKYPPAGTGSRDGSKLDAKLPRKTSHGRRRGNLKGPGGNFASRGNFGRGRLFFFCRFSLRNGFLRRRGFFLFGPIRGGGVFFRRGLLPFCVAVYFYKDLVYPHGVPGAHAHVDDSSVGRGRDFNGCLVRFHFKQGLFERNPVSGRNENLYYLSGFDSFSKFWKPELYQLTFPLT